MADAVQARQSRRGGGRGDEGRGRRRHDEPEGRWDTMLMTSLHMMTLQGAEGTAVGEADDLVAALVRIAPWKLWTKSWTISVVHVTTNTNGNFHQVEDPIRTQIAAMTRAESKSKVVAG